jgi:hypothetical protein
MSASAEVTISCPHCRRQYNMKIDPERLQRLKTRATCGRCGKTFDAASRIVSAQQQQQQQQQQQPPQAAPQPQQSPPPAEAKPKADPPTRQPIAVQQQGTLRSLTSPELRDEMEELAREFAEAAARFTPVGVKRSAIGLGGSSLALDAAPLAKPSAVEEPTDPGITPASVLAAKAAAPSEPSPAPEPSAPSPPSAIEPTSEVAGLAAELADQFSLDAEPAGEEEFAAAVPTLSRVPVAPRSWLDLSDPGLASLESPHSAGARALEALFHESETIALPPPPTAS